MASCAAVVIDPFALAAATVAVLVAPVAELGLGLRWLRCVGAAPHAATVVAVNTASDAMRDGRTRLRAENDMTRP